MRVLLTLIFLSLISSCLTGDGTTSIEFLDERGASSGSTTPITNAVVSNVTLNSNNELVITGSSLNIVDAVKITGPSSYNQAFQIKSKTATQLIIGANTTFAVNALLNLIFTNATGAATHTINFALNDASVTGAKLATGTVGVDRLMNGSTVGTNEFLKWDGSKFVGEAIGASQVMLGDWNADTNRTSTSGFTQAIADNCVYDGGTANNGEYFVVTTADPAQPIDGISSWAVKDWIMCSSSNWIKITRTSVGDNSDVDTSGSTSGGILYFNNNNARWEATGEVSVTVGTVVEFANDVKVGNLAGGGVRCIQVDNNGQLQAASCATANTGIDGGSGGSVSATSGDVTVVAANNKTVTTTVGGSTIVQVDQAGMSMNGYAISNVATPTTDQDVANKGYVDAAIAGAGADDLGNHTATQNLDLAGFNITNAGLIDGVNINSVTENATAVGAHGLSISANLTAINNNALLLGGRTLTTQAPNSGQVLKWDGSKWAPGIDNSGAGGGIAWTATGPEQIHSSRLTDTNNTIASLSSTITANQTSIGVLNNSVTTLEAAGQWSKNSNDILYLTGNVGIGTPTPGQKFSVFGNSDGEFVRFRRYGGTNNPMFGFNFNDSDNESILVTSGTSVPDLVFQMGVDERMRLTGAGNLGIGTPSPTVKLEIAADTDSSAPVGGLGCAFNGVTCNCNTNYTFHDNDLDGLVDAGECYERSIYSKGTIGLGTTDPKAKLHIQQGHAIFESNLNAPNGSLLVFEKSRGAAVVQDQDELGVIDFYGTSSAPAYTRAARIAVDVDGSNINATQIPGQINFYTDDGSVSTSGTVQRMVIKSTGEVGIGLNNPMAQLGINGELGLTEMAVDPTSTSGWGKLFVSQADNKLYYMSETGTKTDLLAGGGGGTPTVNSVSTTEIINHSITGTDIATNTVTLGNVNFASSDGLGVPTLASSPSVNAVGGALTASDTGFMYYDSTLNALQVWDGDSFENVADGGVDGIISSTTTTSLSIDSNGNVGIGTTTPTHPLAVNGIIKSLSGGFELPDGTIIASASDLGGGGFSADVLFDGNQTASGWVALSADADDYEFLMISFDLQTGTNTPNVDSADWESTLIMNKRVIDNRNTLTDPRDEDRFTLNADGTQMYYRRAASNNALKKIWGYKVGGGGSISGVVSNTSTTSLTIASSGNVGIGTTTLTHKLTVNGAIKSLSGGFELPDGTVIDDASDLGGGSSSIVILDEQSSAPTAEADKGKVYYLEGNSQGDTYTKLLLLGDGTGSTFTDNSSSTHSVAAQGGVTQTTTHYIFGSKSIYSDGVDDYLSITDSADFTLNNSDDWTIDFWWRTLTASGVEVGMLGTTDGSGNKNGWTLRITNGGNLKFAWGNGSNVDNTSFGGWSHNTSQWYHIALVHSGGTVKAYIDGAKLGSNVSISGTADGDELWIGRADKGSSGSWGGNSYISNSYYDEVRISKGIARWTADFTPPGRSIVEGDIYFKSENGTAYSLTTGGSSSGGGGGGLTTNSIDSSHIQASAVTSSEIADGTVVGTDIATNTVTLSNVNFASSDGLGVPTLASSPSVNAVGGALTASDTGFMYYDSTLNALQVWDGDSFENVADGGVDGITSSTTTTSLSIDSNGNVGIGTTSPSGILDVENLDGEKSLYVNLGSKVGPVAGGRIEMNAASNVTSGNAGYILLRSGMGISGTANSGYVDIASGVTTGSGSTGAVTFATGNNTGTGDTGNVNIKTGATTSTGTVGSVLIDSGSPGGTSVAGHVVLQSSGNGNVGIGTTSPAQKLVVSGSQHVQQELLSTSSGTSNQVATIYSNSDSTERFYTGLDDDGANAYHIGNANFTSKYFTVLNNGNVGVGTTDPQEKLDVVGGDIGLDNNQSLLFSNVAASGSLGIKADTNDSINFRTGGFWDRLVISDSGNVGIGTTSPSVPLEIKDGLGISDLASGRGAIQIGAYSSQHMGIDNNEIQVSNNGAAANLLLQANGGNVGIGTSSPDYKFQVVDSSNNRVAIGDGDAHTGISDWSTTGPVVRLSRMTNGNNNIHGLFSYDATNTGQYNLGLGTRGDLVFTTGGASTYNNSIERMRIDDDGNVGIGTSAPSSQLELGNGLNKPMEFNALKSVSSLNPGTSTSASMIEGAEGYHLVMDLRNNDGNDAFALRYSSANNSTVDTIGMVMKGDGNVGIGVTTPTAKLEVKGGAAIGEAVSDNTGAKDFATGNIQYTTEDCKAFDLHNLKSGGAYTFVVQGTTSATCSFNAYSDAGSTALTVHMPEDHDATVDGKHTIYSMIVAGTHIYFSWVKGL